MGCEASFEIHRNSLNRTSSCGGMWGDILWFALPIVASEVIQGSRAIRACAGSHRKRGSEVSQNAFYHLSIGGGGQEHHRGRLHGRSRYRSLRRDEKARCLLLNGRASLWRLGIKEVE
jgi:hypothetical protein